MANPAIVDIASEIGNLLKIKYGEAIVEQTNMTPAAWKMFDQAENVELTGDHFEFPARLQFPWSVGPRAMRGGMPVAQTTLERICKVYLKFHYGFFDITGPDMEKARNRTDAYVIALSDRMASLTTAFLKMLAFQMYRSGTGLFSKVTALPGTATQVTVNSVKHLRVGMRLDIWDDSASKLLFGSANSTVAANFYQIVAIDAKNLLVTLSQNRPGGMAVNDQLVPETGLATDATQIGIFLNGLGAIIDDGTEIDTFQGIQRSTNPLWKSNIFDLAGGRVQLQDMQLLCDIPEGMTGSMIDVLLTSYNIRSQYLGLLVAQKRFVNEQTLDGGFRALEYNGKTLMVDVDHPDGEMEAISRQHIKRFGLFEPKFDESDGSVLKWLQASGDTFGGYIKSYINFGTDRSNAHAKLKNAEESVDYRYAA